MLQSAQKKISRRIGRSLAYVLPPEARTAFMRRLAERDLASVVEAVGPELNRRPDIDSMAIDLPWDGNIQFDQLAGLFASTSLNHGVISMTVRQAAYIFGLVRRSGARRAIEIGRYKGGSTVLIASAMGTQGELWSIDNGEKEVRLEREEIRRRPYDDQIREFCEQHHFRVHLLVGDSRRIAVDTGEVDVAFIDGDHSYEGVRNDFERFGRRVRVGGAVLFDDAFDEANVSTTHSDTVGRLVREIVDQGQYRLVRAVNRLAHLERLA